MDLGQVLPNPLQRLVLPPRPVVLSGSVIQSNNALGINQDPFPVREPACAGIDRSGGVDSTGATLLPGCVCVCSRGSRGPTRKDKTAEKQPASEASPSHHESDPLFPPAAVQFAACQRGNLSLPEQEHHFLAKTSG